MGWITNVYFPDGVESDSVEILPGVQTQVRWDMGIGTIVVNGEGQIVEATHLFPQRGAKGKAQVASILKWNGYLDTTMGVLFFNQGKITHLDFSSDRRVGSYFIDHCVGTHPWVEDGMGNIHASMSDEELPKFIKELDEYRESMTKPPSSKFRGIINGLYSHRPKQMADPYFPVQK